MKGFNRWLRSKQGLTSIAGVLIVALLVVSIGQLAGWWNILGALSGAAGIPAPDYPAPVGGYTCLPTCDEKDGKFFVLPGEGTNSFTAWPIVVWIGVPGSSTTYELGIFDGDSGKDNTGAINWQAGNWENGVDELVYTLYADPLANGSGQTVLNTWRGNQDNMPNNAWFKVTLTNAPTAKAPSGHYFYRLVVTRPAMGPGNNVFKVRSSGYVRAGNNVNLDAAFGITASMSNMNDFQILHPQNQGLGNPGPSLYTGDWLFYFEVPAAQKEITIWDGDFDRGTVATPDTNDQDTPDTVPDFAVNSPAVVAERAGGAGIPTENSSNGFYQRGGPVYYEIIGTLGTYADSEPSGTEEWEKFTVASSAGSSAPFNRDAADLSAPSLPGGVYAIHIVGLDISNHVWLRTNFYICDPEDGCGPPIWEGGGCALPVSYWRTNFGKLYKNEKAGMVQESKESLEWALRNVALGSLIFRDGINVDAPAAITNATALAPLKALDVLKGKDRQPMARALKHNLAAWLNLGSGKIKPTTPAYLNVTGGYFEGTVWEALKEAESLILNNGDLKRAAELAELITYGGTFEEPPKAALPPAPVPVVPTLPQNPATCGARINVYSVSPATTPFTGVKFQYTSGTEVMNGNYDEFRVTVPADVATALTSVQMEARSAGDVGQVTLQGCNFAGPLPCGDTVKDVNRFFAFYFAGAVDNGDGTRTMIFYVQNFTTTGLTSVTIGVTPSSPIATYQSQVCPPLP